MTIRRTILLSVALHAGLLVSLTMTRSSRIDLPPVPVSLLNDAPTAHAPPKSEAPPPKKHEPIAHLAEPAEKATAASEAPAAAPPPQASGPTSLDAGAAGAPYLTRLWGTIESQKSYPALARSRGQTGKVVVRFRLMKTGQIVEVHLQQASPFESLNSAAMATVEQVARFEPIPDALSKTDLQLTITLNYSLN